MNISDVVKANRRIKQSRAIVQIMLTSGHLTELSEKTLHDLLWALSDNLGKVESYQTREIAKLLNKN